MDNLLNMQLGENDGFGLSELELDLDGVVFDETSSNDLDQFEDITELDISSDNSENTEFESFDNISEDNWDDKSGFEGTDNIEFKDECIAIDDKDTDEFIFEDGDIESLFCRNSDKWDE